MRHWYTHLIEIELIISELDKMELSKAEKLHLAHLVDSNLHHRIMDAVLTQLQDEDKRVFMRHLNEDNHDKIWQFLNEKVDDIEIKIKKAAGDLMEELKKDLKEAKK